MNETSTIAELTGEACLEKLPVRPVATMPEASIVQSGDNLEVVASTPTQLGECQHSLIDWMKKKIESVKEEIRVSEAESLELKQAYEYAVKQKWKKDVLLKHHQTADKRTAHHFERLDYYHKLLTALESGYYIVPPLDMELFAIRTDRNKPSPMSKILHWKNQGNFEQDAKTLPEGEGEYQNPHPKIEQHPWKQIDNADKTTSYPFKATEWQEIEFPANMVKPVIMEATTRAMVIKVFDELGVLPQDRKRNPDPVILGRIYAPETAGYYGKKCITFMIAWHLNTKDL